ncbi:MAG: ribosome small subunit-dependent GTPase A [Pseudomonadota bacterium]|jgi:ribosome biogenesis GTPase|nr:ribosome small subunit-dependent GTPase A [Pseudomonadota bacterium]
MTDETMHAYSLTELGWQRVFRQQLTLEELERWQPMRLIEQSRHEVTLIGEQGCCTISLLSSMPQMVVGDWVLVNSEGSFERLLDRSTCFRRIAAGHQKQEQLIASNVNTAFIVCSLNDDFNLNRIERYLAMVYDAGAEPVIVLTKKDLREDWYERSTQVRALSANLSVESVNSLEPKTRQILSPWCRQSHTVVMLGSSGAGKSTLTNTLLGEQRQLTAKTREDDSKGRHTTTARSLISMAGGAMLLDTPGMRELQLVDMKAGIAATFYDIETLAGQCRFNDCRHDSEPGCAVQAAIAAGTLAARRLENYNKLMREQALNAATLAQRRAGDKSQGKFIKKGLNQSVRKKRGL